MAIKSPIVDREQQTAAKASASAAVPDSAAVIPYILYSFTAPKRLPFCSCFCAKGIAISTGSVAMIITQ